MDCGWMMNYRLIMDGCRIDEGWMEGGCMEDGWMMYGWMDEALWVNGGLMEG